MRLLTERLRYERTFDPKTLYDGTGNTLVLANLTGWGANANFLTNGGGKIHWAEHINPYSSVYALARGEPQAFVINETGAGSAALAYALLSGRPAVCNVTTGGAADLANAAFTDSKFHSIGAILFAALSPEESRWLGILQDTSEDGYNTIGVMRARYGDDACVVVDSSFLSKTTKFEEMLYKMQDRLLNSKPVVVVYHPEVMKENVPWLEVPWREKSREYDKVSLDKIVANFAKNTDAKKVVVFVGEEAVRYEGIDELITQLSRVLKAPTIYTQIGVSAVSPDNEFAAGHVMLGYNDYALKLWKSLTTDDTVICVGFDPFEYSTNQEIIKANGVVITNYDNAYGTKNGTFAHRFEGKYHHIKGDLDLILTEIIKDLRRQQLKRPHIEVPKELNEDRYVAPPSGFTNMKLFYQELARFMQPGTIYCADVCMGYKDFQRVNPRPLNGIKSLYFHQGSLMGKAGGEILGHRLARPDLHIVAVTGDGCNEYFGASLGRMKDLGLLLFVLDNGTHGLVDWGLGKIKPHLPPDKRLTHVPRNDYVGMAVAQGWRGYHLDPDLIKMEKIMQEANSIGSQSMLVQVKVHPDDDLGQNRRLEGLKKQGKEQLVSM